MNPLDVLTKYWGHNSFKGSQEAVINAVLAGSNVVALLPTGGGKSICFQVPALVQEGVCVVVTPLIALMDDQVNELRQRGIKALALGGALTEDDISVAFDNCRYGNYKFLYLSPERLQNPLVQKRLGDLQVSLIAIDEAHCISQWGNDFRPAYLDCVQLRTLCPGTALIALTATATPYVLQDIISRLDLKSPAVIRDSFARPNIAISVRKDQNKRKALLELLGGRDKSAIVYVRSRRRCEALATFLKHNAVSAAAFHGGFDADRKRSILNDWLAGDIQVVVATNAFGMGIDKADVQLVVHYQIPDSIESYFQEAGRAGRDGQPASAILLMDQMDEAAAVRQFVEALPSIDFIKKVYLKLNMHYQVAYAEHRIEALPFNFSAFCEHYHFDGYQTYNVLKLLDQHAVISFSPYFSRRTTLRITATKQDLWHYLDAHPKDAVIVQAILRTYGGVLDFSTPINTVRLSKKLGITESEISKALKSLDNAAMAAFEEEQSDMEICFLVPREDDKTINRIAGHVKSVQERKISQLRQMLTFVNFADGCRQKWILAYFGETLKQDCGICDWCADHLTAKPESEDIAQSIKGLLGSASRNSRDIVDHLPYERKLVIEVLQDLLEEGELKINSSNEYYILE